VQVREEYDMTIETPLSTDARRGIDQLRDYGTRHWEANSTLVVVCCLLLSLTASAQTPATAKRPSPIEPLPRDLEIQLALSSLPAHLRDDATVYVLNPSKGFEVARKGTNGFHALVARTGDDAMRGTWPLTEYPDDVLYPVSWDQAGAKAQLRVFLDIAEMQASGTPPQEAKRIIQQRYKTNAYKAPERPGVSYMLSPVLRTYTNPDENGHVATSNIPHVMHYAPNVSSEDVGAAPPKPEDLRYYSQHGRWPASPSPFVIMHGPHGYHIQFLGVAETAALTSEYKEMLARLCKIKDTWCLPSAGQ
jgi:hypothetical protein